jgi:hypothetical protein
MRREHFIYSTWHCSGYERRLSDQGLCDYIPMLFRNVVPYYRQFLTVNVAMAAVTAMDRHGYFNLSCATGVPAAFWKKPILSFWRSTSTCPGSAAALMRASTHLRGGFVVEGEHPPLPEFPIAPPTEEDVKIADLIVPISRTAPRCSWESAVCRMWWARAWRSPI